MVYMNGDNNLETFALRDFREMARIGSNSDVNVVVQLDRIGKYAKPAPGEPLWTDTKRFFIRKGSRSIVSESLASLGEVNMGDPNALEEFVRWARSAYPAKRYALVIWDHGQGFRDLTEATELSTSFRSSTLAPHRSVSDDDTNKDKLFNSEVTAALRSSLAGQKLDILGFDACLMAMVETAYGMRDVAHYMVASEELEPGDGWQYDDLLQRLEGQSRASTRDVAALFVTSYRDSYSPGRPSANPTTTQSSIDLAQASALASAVSNLADELAKSLSSHGQEILNARLACTEYAPGADPRNPKRILFHHVDLGRFAQNLASSKHDGLRRSANEVLKSIGQAVTANYAGAERQGAFGSMGLAIYFPRDGTEYRSDVYEQGGYKKDNREFPVAFVRDHRWADFLNQYFQTFVSVPRS
jgi:hypothetical protein